MREPCCGGVPWHKEECLLFGLAAGGFGPFDQEKIDPAEEALLLREARDMLLREAAAREADRGSACRRGGAGSSSNREASSLPGANDAAWRQQQQQLALERQQRFANNAAAPLPEKKVMAWAGGKIETNKSEALEAFIERKRKAGVLNDEQEVLLYVFFSTHITHTDTSASTNRRRCARRSS